MSLGGDGVRELVECLYSAVDRQDWSTVEELVSPRAVVEVGSGGPIGRDAWLDQLRDFHGAFPDGRHVVVEVLVDGSHGVSRCRFEGTHNGDFQGLAPTGTRVRVNAIHIDRFQGDSLVAHWAQLDMHGLLLQLRGDRKA
jgi:predicted ester cyclase